MNEHANVDRSIRAWLIAEAPERASLRLLDASRERIQTTRQRRALWPVWRSPAMSTYAKLAAAAAAVVALAFVGLTLLPSGGGASVGAPAATPSVSPASEPSPSQSPVSRRWPVGDLAAQRYHVSTQGVPLSFALPSTRWRSMGTNPSGDAIATGIDTGSAPEGADFAWIVFPGLRDVATDPCAGRSAPVNGSSVDALAAALGTIPGTRAAEPEDVTIGGLPGKLVTLTIDPDPPCAMNEFWLYGDTSLYPNSVNSIIRIWITAVDGKRWAVHTDQADVNPQNEREIQQIIGSIRFE